MSTQKTIGAVADDSANVDDGSDASQNETGEMIEKFRAEYAATQKLFRESFEAEQAQFVADQAKHLEDLDAAMKAQMALGIKLATEANLAQMEALKQENLKLQQENEQLKAQVAALQAQAD